MADVNLFFNVNSTRWKLIFELNRHVFQVQRFVYSFRNYNVVLG